jgi:hypothetical protein
MRTSRWFGAGCVLALSAASCGDGGGGTASEVTSAADTAVVSTVVEEPIDLVYISDSSGRVTATEYAALVEQQLGRPVRFTDWRFGGQMLSDELALIQRNPDVIADAEIIVIWGNHFGAGMEDDMGSCISPSESKTPVQLSEEDWAPFRQQLETTLQEIWRIRDGAPVVLRATDIYAANIAEWRELGIFDVCTASAEAMSAAVRAGAEAQNAVFVSTYDVYNGPEHDQDPRATGYLTSDGIHPSEVGGAAMANALAAVGYEPSTAP